MNLDTETIKWLVAIPGALLASVSIPLVIRKQLLECRKLKIEILEKEKELLESSGIYVNEVEQDKKLEWLRWYTENGWQIAVPVYFIFIVLSLLLKNVNYFLFGSIAMGVLCFAGAISDQMASSLAFKLLQRKLEKTNEHLK
jgi:hypothetical protein